MLETMILPTDNLKLIEMAQTLIIKHEGMELTEYTCPAGFASIGGGKRIDFLTDSQKKLLKKNAEGKYTIDLNTATDWVRQDIIEINKQLTRESWYDGLSLPRKVVVIDIVYNIGMGRFKTFKNFISALAARDFDKAAYELEYGTAENGHSHYYNQVTNRAKRNIEILKTNIL